jgi:hypothetical protein
MLVEVYNSSEVFKSEVCERARECAYLKSILKKNKMMMMMMMMMRMRRNGVGGGVDMVICLLIMQQVPDTLARFFAGREDLYLLKINTSKVFPIPEPCSCPILRLILTCCKSLLQQGSSP